MNTFVSPQLFLVSLLAGWLNPEQQKILEFLQEEVATLVTPFHVVFPVARVRMGTR